MIRNRWLQLSLLLSLLGLYTVIAQAQATRTWVSGVGDDVNPCSRTAPCKTFAGAISKTATNGEINCLDPGGFGAVTITKSITLDCKGVNGSILAAQINGIVINSADATVRIRGLSINGAGTGINGIKIMAAAKVNIENSVIDGFTQNGIAVSTSGDSKLPIVIANCSIRNIAGSGISVSSTGGGAEVVVANSLITGNATGVTSAQNSTVRLTNTTIAFNTTGVAGQGKVFSSKNNFIEDNGTNGTVTAAPLQ